MACSIIYSNQNVGSAPLSIDEIVKKVFSIYTRKKAHSLPLQQHADLDDFMLNKQRINTICLYLHVGLNKTKSHNKEKLEL